MALYYTRLTRAVERKINTTRDVPFNPPFRLSMGILFSTRLLQILERKFPRAVSVLLGIEDTVESVSRRQEIRRELRFPRESTGAHVARLFAVNSRQ